jgi:CubicO group peptidase (beta-lactamase class C family)
MSSVDRRSFLVTGGAALLAACTPRPTPGTFPVAQQSTGRGMDDPAIAEWMRGASVPGISVALLESGRVTTRGYGLTKAGGTAIDANTVFEAASLSKPVFGYLVMQLVAEGTLDLDRPLAEFLPVPNPADARSAKITARHALSHSGGWRNWRFNATQALTADFEPGSRFSYSGEGFYFLSRVVEKLTGQSILRLSRERVFQPLGMTRTSYLWLPALDPNRAEPHSNRGVAMDSFGARMGRSLGDAMTAASRTTDALTHDEVERVLPTINREASLLPNNLAPNVAGSLMTTASDYARFVQHLMSGDGRAMLDRMMAPQVTAGESVKWGLGVGLQVEGPRTSFWHWGDNPGFKNFFVADPAARRGIVVFTNGNAGRAVYERVVRSVYGSDQPLFLWI